MAITIWAASLPCLAAPPACLSYGSDVQLRGVLTRQTYPGPPNYTSVAQGDRAETYFFITPSAPICVHPGHDDTEPEVARAGKLQLIFTNQPQAAYQQLRPLLNQTVVCSGLPVHSISGHHHTDILLFGAHCGKAPHKS